MVLFYGGNAISFCTGPEVNIVWMSYVETMFFFFFEDVNDFICFDTF